MKEDRDRDGGALPPQPPLSGCGERPGRPPAHFPNLTFTGLCLASMWMKVRRASIFPG